MQPMIPNPIAPLLVLSIQSMQTHSKLDAASSVQLGAGPKQHKPGLAIPVRLSGSRAAGSVAAVAV